MKELLVCYNMYPGMFKNIRDMTLYLPQVKRMGFSTIWINPIQMAGAVACNRSDKETGIKAPFKSSIYATAHFDKIDPRVRVSANESENTTAIIEFTTTAHSFDQKVIFDVVLHHVSNDSPLIKQKKTWFANEKSVFGDTTAFNYENEAIRMEILETLWKPFIYKYLITYGFDGVRVDCVHRVPFEVRKEIYAYIKSLKPDAIIFEEALFSDKTPEQYARETKSAGGSHVTGSVYFRERAWHGGLSSRSPLGEPGDPNNEEFYKRNMVSVGVVNFPGNHDEYTCAMTVIREMAREMLRDDKELNASYNYLFL